MHCLLLEVVHWVACAWYCLPQALVFFHFTSCWKINMSHAFILMLLELLKTQTLLGTQEKWPRFVVDTKTCIWDLCLEERESGYGDRYAEARYQFSQSWNRQCYELIFYDICKTRAMNGERVNLYFNSRKNVVRNNGNWKQHGIRGTDILKLHYSLGKLCFAWTSLIEITFYGGLIKRNMVLCKSLDHCHFFIFR